MKETQTQQNINERQQKINEKILQAFESLSLRMDAITGMILALGKRIDLLESGI